MSKEKEMLTVTEALEVIESETGLKVAKSTVYHWINRNGERLPAKKILNRVMINRQDLLDYIKKQSQ